VKRLTNYIIKFSSREKPIDNCGHIDDANLQAARNVKVKAIEPYGLNIVKRMKSKMVRGDS
jgi:hypothetical protein